MKLKLLLLMFSIFLFIEVALAVCEDQGYTCRDMNCGPGQEQVHNLYCPPFTEGSNRPVACCREVILEGVTPKLTLNKLFFEEGDALETYYELPYFASCNFSIINPLGEERFLGAGGCGPSGMSSRRGNIHQRAALVFGELITGEYTARSRVTHQTQPKIVLEQKFFLLEETHREIESCSFSGSSGVCGEGLNQYIVERNGCGLNVDVSITHQGVEDFFSRARVSEVLSLSSGQQFRVTGAPCSASNFNLEFFSQSTIIGEGSYKVNDQSTFNINNLTGSIAEVSSNNVLINFEQNNCVLNNNNFCSTENEFGLLNFTLIHFQHDEAIINIDYLKKVNVISPINEPVPMNLQNSNDVMLISKNDDFTYTTINQINFICEGCTSQTTCYPQEFRLDEEYCFENSFRPMKSPGDSCEFSFECENFDCDLGICKQNALQRFTSFVRNIFG